MNYKKHIITSFTINILGLFSIFFIDIHISKTNNDILISYWALTKSTLFIGLIFVLLGLDQAIVRLKLKLEEIIVPAIIQFLFTSAIIVYFVYLIKSQNNLIYIFISLFFLAISYLYYAEYRLNLNYLTAQICVNGWKISFLLLLVIFKFYNFIYILPIAIFLNLAIVFKKRGLFSVFKKVKWINYLKILKTGLHYFITLIALALTLYMDQILLNFDHKVIDSSLLFSHITFFVGPNAVLIGFGGFLLVPYLKKRENEKNKIFKKYIFIFLIIIFFIVFISFFIDYYLFIYFKSPKKPNIILAIGLSIVVYLRYLYIIPSSYIGSFAKNNLIRKVGSIDFFAILIYLILYFSLSRIFHTYLYAILISIIIVWIIRIINGYYAIFKILKYDELL